jgi:archaellum component FlaC
LDPAKSVDPRQDALETFKRMTELIHEYLERLARDPSTWGADWDQEIDNILDELQAHVEEAQKHSLKLLEETVARLLGLEK